jgi:hypothetical protein
MLSTIIPFAGGAEIFAVFLIVFFLAVAYGLFSRGGSAINARPYGNPYDSASGARGEGSYSNDREAARQLTRGTR